MFAISELPTINCALEFWNLGKHDAATSLLPNFGAAAGTRLAVYGSLAPGERNEHILATIPGSWTRGIVRGFFGDAGWGRSLGYRSLVWDPEGREVSVQVFESTELAQHWPRIDEFEGSDYRRILVPVVSTTGIIIANLYAAAD